MTTHINHGKQWFWKQETVLKWLYGEYSVSRGDCASSHFIYGLLHKNGPSSSWNWKNFLSIVFTNCEALLVHMRKQKNKNWTRTQTDVWGEPVLEVYACCPPEGVRPLVPAELSTDAVGDGGDELSSEAQLRAELQSKRFWWVLLLWHVPFELVHQRDVPHMNV